MQRLALMQMGTMNNLMEEKKTAMQDIMTKVEYYLKHPEKNPYSKYYYYEVDEDGVLTNKLKDN
tara:strand:- start:1470 stop:1661 length:192 start_codon:yes stop_codon:yes gene_type:complete